MSDGKSNVTTDNQVLAACFTVEGAITRFAEELNPQDVGYVHGFNGIHELFKSMLSYHRSTKLGIVDPVGFKSWLGTETELLDSMGGEQGFNDLYKQHAEVEIPSIDALIKLVIHRANKRRKLDHAQALQELISKSDASDPAAHDKIIALTEEINGLYQDLDYDPLASVRTANDIIKGMNNLWDIPPFLKTPFPVLNKAMGYTENGGFFRGGVHSIVAMSGFGKSTLAKCLCNFWLDEGHTVLFVNFEEPESHWERVLMTQITEHNVYAEAESLSKSERDMINMEFEDRLSQWGDRLMVRHDPDTLYFEDLEKWMRDILGYGARKPDIVVIDTIQSMFKKTGGSARWGDYEYMMVRLEKLAKDMDAVFIITAQQNINATKEKREELNQSDMGGSVTITQKSTVAMFITPQRGSDNDHDHVGDRVMELQITKNRITGTVYKDSPPLLEYRDDIKSYISYDPSVSDPRYNIESVDLDLDGY